MPRSNKNDKSKNKKKISFSLIRVNTHIRNFFVRLKEKLNFSDFYQRLTIFSEKISPRGIWLIIVSLLCDLLNLLTLGLFVFLSFAVFAFNIVKNPMNQEQKIHARFLDIHGNYIGQRGQNWGKDIEIEELPDYFVKAILATEDRRFFQHWGVDIVGILRAFVKNSKSENVVQGGSTLTQQLAKNLYLTNQRTITRKINEAFIALWLEANLTKKEIITKYLNNVYMGAGAYGVQNAAHVYFNKDVRHINLSEAAMLAGLFKAPSNYAPHRHLKAARQRADVVLNNLVDKGFMSESEVTEAKKNPADFIPSTQQKTPGYFLDWVYSQLQKINMESPLNDRYVIVYTTFNPFIQTAAENAVEKVLKEYGKGYRVSQAATVVINHDGAINAIVGGKDYEDSQFNRATIAQRQAGSSFKVYSYAALFERTNLTPQSYVVDGPFSWGNWSPRNISRRHYGRIPIADAIAYSYNTIPPKLVYEYFRSTAPVIETAKALGVKSKLDTNRAMVLGTSGMTVIEQAEAYHTLANGGRSGTVHGINMIKSDDGKILWTLERNAKPVEQAIKPRTAALMNSALSEVVNRGSGRRAQLSMTQAAGKTGTSQEYRDAWFIGYTGNYTAAVWVGNDNFKPMNRVTGGLLPAMIWQNMMEIAHQNVQLRPIFGLENKTFIPKPQDHNTIVQQQEKSFSINLLTEEMIPILLDLQSFSQDRLANLTKGKR